MAGTQSQTILHKNNDQDGTMTERRMEIVYRPTWAQVDLEAIRHNFRQIRRLFPQKKIIAVVKADAYGHGIKAVARLLDKEQVDVFGVANVCEGIQVRRLGIQRPILIMESLLAPCQEAIVRYNLTPSICTLAFARLLNRYAEKKNRIIDVHIKVDTGMGRLGVWYEEALAFVRQVFLLPHLRTTGLYTHFPSADSDTLFTKRQIRALTRLVGKLDGQGLVIPNIHEANSMGLIGYQTNFNLARPGLMLYGLSPKPRGRFKIPLKPALSVKSTIVFCKEIAKGRSISYGRTFIAPRRMTIATLPIGYNDGYMRCLSNKSFCLVGGQRCRVLGRVTMDQLMIDVSRVKNLRLGMEAVLLGRQGKISVSADDLARWAKTVNYEIVCSLGNRLPRVYQ